METIVINQATGLVLIGPYTFHPHLTYSEVQFNYPTLKHQVVDNIMHPLAHVDLPQVEFLNYPTEIRLSFFDQHPSSIAFSCAVERVTDATYEEGLHQLVGWTRYVKGWLSTQFGPPHQITPPVLLDHDRWLSADEIAHLDYWIYSHVWGEFGYTFHWQTSASVHVHFDKPYQMRDWHGLRAECRYLQHVNQRQLVERTRRLSLIESAIDRLSAHYDYMTVRAMVSPDLNCLVFDLRQWETKAIVDVRPDFLEKPYRITRHDTVQKAYADATSLVDALRPFLETEHL